MAIDAMKGKFKYFEDFLVTAIGDLPEIDVQSATGVTTAILANTHGGAVEIPMGTTDDDDVGAVTTNLNYDVSVSDVECESRLRVETITDPKYFVGFCDTIASADETTFSATSDTVTIDTMSNAIGFLFDNDATTKNIWCVAGATDSVTVGQVLSSDFNPSADEWVTFRVFVAKGGQSAQWSINGKEVHRVYSTSQVVAATSVFCAGVWNYEQGTAADIEVDSIMAAAYRG